MRIIIAGGTGFIGQALTHHFLSQGHEVVILGRDKNKIQNMFANRVTTLDWSEFIDKQTDLLLTSDVVINLAGANIGAKRWTTNRKRDVINSRVMTTATLATSLAKLGENAPPLFNASAIGIYGPQTELPDRLPDPFTEAHVLTQQFPDFLSTVAHDWEAATEAATKRGVRVVLLRFAPVLGKGGMLKQLHRPFSLGLGGPLGSGRQPFSWVALTDVINAIDFLIRESHIQGPVNLVSPTCLTQRQFARAFAEALHRPCRVSTPPFLLNIIFGEMAKGLLLNGQCAYPQVLLSHGFQFQHTDIKSALQDIFK